VSDDESAQYEEKIDEQKGVAEEVQRIDRAEDVQVKDRDKHRGNAPPRIQHAEMHFQNPFLFVVA
jgi:hypothetical protein